MIAEVVERYHYTIDLFPPSTPCLLVPLWTSTNLSLLDATLSTSIFSVSLLPLFTVLCFVIANFMTQGLSSYPENITRCTIDQVMGRFHSIPFTIILIITDVVFIILVFVIDMLTDSEVTHAERVQD